MGEKTELNRETFLTMAKALGVDVHDPHAEVLYSYLQRVLPSLQAIWDLDVAEAEPVMPLMSKEGVR